MRRLGDAGGLWIFCGLLALAGGLPSISHAQIQIDIELKRTLFLRYEPMICSVSIRNLSGQDLTLADTPKHAWFGFQIQTPDGRPIMPRGEYQNPSVTLRAGQTIRRAVNLTPLFPITEFGTYRIRAAVYVPEFKKYFSSPTATVEVTEGRILWEQTVGVPPDSGLPGARRKYQVLAHRLPNSTMLYLRVRDPDEGLIYCTTRLGRYLSFGKPDVLVDPSNEIHILQNLAPKEYLYSHFGLDGKVKKQQAYQDWGTRPVFARTAEGGVEVVGGTTFDPTAKQPEQQLPGLEDVPADMKKPKAEASPTPAEEERAIQSRTLLDR